MRHIYSCGGLTFAAGQNPTHPLTPIPDRTGGENRMKKLMGKGIKS